MTPKIKGGMHERKCVSCGKRSTKDSFIKIVRISSGEIFIDTNRVLNGRSAYICHDTVCIRNACIKKRIDHELKTKVPQEIYSALENISGAFDNSGI